MKNKYQEVLDEVDNDLYYHSPKDELTVKRQDIMIKTLQELVDKETPMKIVKYKNDYFGCIMFKCPKCNEELLDVDGCYCCECGQKLDWSDE